MHGCICKYCSHTYTPTHRCWSAKLRAHSMAQEVTADRQIGHLRRCHKGVLQRSGVKNPTYSLFCYEDVLFFLTVTQNIETRRSKADCGSQRHSRPSRIISALERSIILAWGLNADKRAIWGRVGRELQGKAKSLQAAYIRKWGIYISGRDSTHCM